MYIVYIHTVVGFVNILASGNHDVYYNPSPRKEKSVHPKVTPIQHQMQKAYKIR